MKSLLSITLGTFLLFGALSQVSAAAPLGSGKVTRLWVTSNDAFIFQVENFTGTVPSCAVVNGVASTYLTSDLSTVRGQAAFSLLMSAYVNQLDVKAFGSETECFYGNRTKLLSVRVDR